MSCGRAGPATWCSAGTYGDKIHQAFRMTRQGVRWRFQRLFSDIYVSAFETILFIEKTFGPQLREHAIRISKERYELRQQITENGFQSADSLHPSTTNAQTSRPTDTAPKCKGIYPPKQHRRDHEQRPSARALPAQEYPPSAGIGRTDPVFGAGVILPDAVARGF